MLVSQQESEARVQLCPSESDSSSEISVHMDRDNQTLHHEASGAQVCSPASGV